MILHIERLLVWGTMFCVLSTSMAAEPVTLENLVAPEANQKDEPVAESFSMEKAIHFLDSAALDWQKQRGCMTCHTNFAFMYARPTVDADAPAHKTVRAFAEDLVNTRWKESGPRWPAEVVAAAAALAYNDSITTNKLHETTRTALDRMWTIQREDGGFDWLKCRWPPMENDDHYGATLAALAVGVAPEGYLQTEQAQKGIEGIRKYLKANPAPTLHHESMVLWASAYVDGLLTDDERKGIVNKLFTAQHEDGGWSIAGIYPWERADKTPQDTETSDGYGTGFSIFILRTAGVPADDARLAKGIVWLKSNQRTSGRWFTRSLFKDSKHFISHCGTAFAVMAIQSCEAELTAGK
ncbi:MAG: squalene--hopene cyclase [Planctomycetota bacterium]|nr:squalene--hopene cyclase [Planctomycetota bacterium]MDA1211773.1 squalene--hopene cyclase [Planctomycetota bacterium]